MMIGMLSILAEKKNQINHQSQKWLFPFIFSSFNYFIFPSFWITHYLHNILLGFVKDEKKKP